MSLLNRIKGAFRREPPPPVLRNKAGGYAWIKPFGQEFGAGVLAGRAVKTVALNSDGMWLLDPPQSYVITGNCLVRCNDLVAFPGQRVLLVALHDALLEPWKEDGITQSEVRDLYAPNLTKEPACQPS